MHNFIKIKLKSLIELITIKSKNDCNILSSRLNSHKKYH